MAHAYELGAPLNNRKLSESDENAEAAEAKVADIEMGEVSGAQQRVDGGATSTSEAAGKLKNVASGEHLDHMNTSRSLFLQSSYYVVSFSMEMPARAAGTDP